MVVLDPSRILSVQSHVVSGYVGNRAATFPLQTLGYDVDVVNTVQFSNHTGYGHTNGHKTTAEQLSAVFEGLWTNGLLAHSKVLTGYIPGAEALAVVGEQIDRMKKNDGDGGLVYLLDPVMGDIGTGLYVSPDVVPIYKNLLQHATIITPNQFETELLSGIKIDNLSTLQAALHTLHTTYGVPHVVLSSIPMPIKLVEALRIPAPPGSYARLVPDPTPPWYDAVGVGEPDDDVLVCFSSSCVEGKLETYAFALPTIRGYFSGVGDLFSALVLGHYQRPEFETEQGDEPKDADGRALPPLAAAVSRALLTVQQILLKTHLHSLTLAGSGTATPRPLHADGAASSPTSASASAATAAGRRDRPDERAHPDSVIPSDTELDAAPPLHPADPRRKARRMRIREIRVVQERKLIEHGGEGWPAARLDWPRE